jgi:hypothetical protein
MASTVTELVPCRREGGLHLQHILAGFDTENIGSAVEEASDLLEIGVTELVEGDMAQRREFRGGSDGSCDEARFFRRAEAVGHAPRDSRGFEIELVGQVRDVVFGENDAGRTEGIGFDDIRPRFQKSTMHRFHGGGFGDDEILVAALEFGSAEILGRKILRLQVGTGGAVEYEHPGFQCVGKRCIHVQSIIQVRMKDRDFGAGVKTR